jgi:hypothetical protein
MIKAKHLITCVAGVINQFNVFVRGFDPTSYQQKRRFGLRWSPTAVTELQAMLADYGAMLALSPSLL